MPFIDAISLAVSVKLKFNENEISLSYCELKTLNQNKIPLCR